MYRIITSVCLLLFLSACSERVSETSQKNNSQKSNLTSEEIFTHGVASGDPLEDAVILWTRVNTIDRAAVVRWEISDQPDFSNIVRGGNKSTSAASDFTIKVDATKLQPGTKYYYRFIFAGVSSVVGQTKTLSTDTERTALAIVSCSNYEFGYFNAYNKIATTELDAVVHLGDYIYEYQQGVYGDSAFVRKHQPDAELISLEDYRTRYAQYRTDEALQKAHQMHPFIMIWDDHEIANNAYVDGAQNHQEDEGDYMARKRAAKKAYYEWQPIRDQPNGELYRKFSFGNNVDLLMLDERYTGREEPSNTIEGADKERTMLGQKQYNWFTNQLKQSDATWKIVGNQVIFSPTDLSLVRPEDPINLDAWDGYAYERDKIINHLNSENIKNTIFITGDTHASWAFEVPSDITTYKETPNSCAVEIGTPSITSSNWNERTEDQKVLMAEGAIKATNPHLNYVNGRDHGYAVIILEKGSASAQWFYSENIKVKEAPVMMAHEVSIVKDVQKIK